MSARDAPHRTGLPTSAAACCPSSGRRAGRRRAGRPASPGWARRCPAGIPSVSDVTDALRDTYIPDEFLVKALALVCWLVWIELVASLLVEAVAYVRGRKAGAVPLAGGLQRGAARLVAGVALLGALVATRGLPTSGSAHLLAPAADPRGGARGRRRQGRGRRRRGDRSPAPVAAPAAPAGLRGAAARHAVGHRRAPPGRPVPVARDLPAQRGLPAERRRLPHRPRPHLPGLAAPAARPTPSAWHPRRRRRPTAPAPAPAPPAAAPHDSVAIDGGMVLIDDGGEPGADVLLVRRTTAAARPPSTAWCCCPTTGPRPAARTSRSWPGRRPTTSSPAAPRRPLAEHEPSARHDRRPRRHGHDPSPRAPRRPPTGAAPSLVPGGGRQRRWSLALLAVLVTLGSALAFVVLWMNAGDRKPVLALRTTSRPARSSRPTTSRWCGCRPTAASTLVASSARDDVVGQPAATNLLAGTLLVAERGGRRRRPRPGHDRHRHPGAAHRGARPTISRRATGSCCTARRGPAAATPRRAAEIIGDGTGVLGGRGRRRLDLRHPRVGHGRRGPGPRDRQRRARRTRSTSPRPRRADASAWDTSPSPRPRARPGSPPPSPRWPPRGRPTASCSSPRSTRAGGDLVVRFDLATEPGLVSLAAAGRRELAARHAAGAHAGARRAGSARDGAAAPGAGGARVGRSGGRRADGAAGGAPDRARRARRATCWSTAAGSTRSRRRSRWPPRPTCWSWSPGRWSPRSTTWRPAWLRSAPPTARVAAAGGRPPVLGGRGGRGRRRQPARHAAGRRPVGGGAGGRPRATPPGRCAARACCATPVPSPTGLADWLGPAAGVPGRRRPDAVAAVGPRPPGSRRLRRPPDRTALARPPVLAPAVAPPGRHGPRGPRPGRLPAPGRPRRSRPAPPRSSTRPPPPGRSGDDGRPARRSPARRRLPAADGAVGARRTRAPVSRPAGGPAAVSAGPTATPPAKHFRRDDVEERRR